MPVVDRVPHLWLDPLWQSRKGRDPAIPLAQFVLLSMLLHAIAIALFGAPGGGSRDGRAMWGSLSVVLTPLIKEAPPAEAPAPPLALKTSKTLSAPAPRAEGRTAPALPATPPSPPAERIAPPAVAIPPLLDRIVSPDTSPRMMVPPPVEAPPAPARPAPPAPAPAAPAPEPPAPPPEIPAAIERILVPQRSMEMAPAFQAPLPAPPPPLDIPTVPVPGLRAPSIRELAEPPVFAAPPVPAPLPAPPVSTPPIAVPAVPVPAIPAPAPAPEGVTPRTESSSVPVDPAPPRPQPAPALPPSRTESAAPSRNEIAPRTLPGAPVETPSLFRSRPAPSPSPSQDYDPTAPSIDVDAAKQRAGELARQGVGQRSLLPFPMPLAPKAKNKMEAAIENARKPDCKTAYAEYGLAAIIPLIANEFGEGKCKW